MRRHRLLLTFHLRLKLQVFPNPFSDQIRITYGDDRLVKWYRTRLIDMHGRVIYDHQMPVPGVVHLERLPAGTYAVVLLDDSGEVLESVVVVKP